MVTFSNTWNFLQINKKEGNWNHQLKKWTKKKKKRHSLKVLVEMNRNGLSNLAISIEIFNSTSDPTTRNLFFENEFLGPNIM